MASISPQPGLRLFYDLAHNFNASLDLDTVLEQVIEQVNHFLNIDATSVSLLDPDSKELVIQMTIGSETDPKPGFRLPPYAGIAGWVARHKEPVLVPDVQSDPRFYPSVDQRTRFTSRSMICVPLIVQNESIGVIQAISASSGAFSHADFYFMIALADVAALHIENARLYKAEQEARQYAQVLKQIAEIIGSSLSLDHVLDSAMEMLQRIVPCDSIAILVKDEAYPQRLPWYATKVSRVDARQDKGLVVLAGYGFENVEQLVKTRVQGQNIPFFEQISFSKHVVTVSDTSLDGRYVSWTRDQRVRSWLGAPLIIDEQIVGLVSIDRHEVCEFTLKETDFAIAFARQISGALENARLYGEARDRADDLAVLNEIFLAVGKSLDLDMILDRVLDVIMVLFTPQATAVLQRSAVDQDLALRAARGFSSSAIDTIQSMAAPGGAIWDGVIGARKTIVADYENKCESDGADAIPCVYVWVPLLANGTVMGALVMQRTDQYQFSIQYLSLLESIGKQIGTAVNNAFVYQQALRSDVRLQNWAKRAQMMIYRAKTDGMLDYVDMAAEAVTGYTAQELLQDRGHLWTQLIVSQDVDRVASTRQELLQDRDRVAYEYQIVCKDGKVCRIWELDIAVGDQEAGSIGWQGVLLKDIPPS